jgi:hypothetical protein
MPLTVMELAELKSRDPYVHSVIKKIVDHINATEKITGVAKTGTLPAPSTPGQISVTALNGWFDIAVQDNSVVQPGISYFAEWDTSPGFTNAHPIFMGPVRNHHEYLGNLTLYWRAYAMYLGSGSRSGYVVFGGVNNPIGVAGGGATTPPPVQKTQGSGTSQVPGYGFGKVPNPRLVNLG